MAKTIGGFLVLFLLAMPSSIMFVGHDGMVMFASAENVEDSVEGEGEDEDEDVDVEEDKPEDPEDTAPLQEGEEEDDDEDKPLKASPEVDTVLLYTRPVGTTEFSAGALIRFLVGFTNNGKQDFIVDQMEASFRYPQDFSFFIQNFTKSRYDRTVEPSRQATFEYAFTPSETFNARPFGLTINLHYRDADGNMFIDAVFNDTVQIVDADEGLDGETFFLYVMMAALVVLLGVGVQQLFNTYGKKRLMTAPKKREVVEMGTEKSTGIDYDWIPDHLLNNSPKSRKSPRQSPRQRRNRTSGAGDD